MELLESHLIHLSKEGFVSGYLLLRGLCLCWPPKVLPGGGGSAPGPGSSLCPVLRPFPYTSAFSLLPAADTSYTLSCLPCTWGGPFTLPLLAVLWALLLLVPSFSLSQVQAPLGLLSAPSHQLLSLPNFGSSGTWL